MNVKASYIIVPFHIAISNFVWIQELQYIWILLWKTKIASSFFIHHPHFFYSKQSYNVVTTVSNIQRYMENKSKVTSKYNEIFGGSFRQIVMEGETQTSFVSKMSVPTFTSCQNDNNENENDNDNDNEPNIKINQPIRKGLEGIIPGAFIIENAISKDTCEQIIQTCENDLYFGSFQAGKNNHGAMQMLVSKQVSQYLMNVIGKYIDISSVKRTDDERIVAYGLNRRWRIYKYNPDTNESFAPHIDAAFPGSGLSQDGETLIWDACNTISDQNDYHPSIMSRLTVLIYLNDDFYGGHTQFYTPLSQQEPISNDPNNTHINHSNVIASIKPKTGSILIFPQGQNENEVEYARQHWPTHEGTPVYSSSSSTHKARPKYVIRSDILFGPSENKQTNNENNHNNKQTTNDPTLFQYDHLVREAFLPQSPTYHPLFLSHIEPLYNPHMGVESIGPFLHSFIRFTKVQSIVEIGAGYTTPWILQALQDNEMEFHRIKALYDEDKCRLLNYPWTVSNYMNQPMSHNHKRGNQDDTKTKTTQQKYRYSLKCVDNCLHQRETATGAMGVARALGLDGYLDFMEGDAFALQFDPESIDLLWCDFGVGSKMKDFIAGGAWESIKPGGFLICHSTLTNESTRNWLESMRQLRGMNAVHDDNDNGNDDNRSTCETGLPPNEEFVEISFLEPHKHYQNSISIFQRRGKGYAEPIYSKYA